MAIRTTGNALVITVNGTPSSAIIPIAPAAVASTMMLGMIAPLTVLYARIINVSSSSHYRIRIDLDDTSFFKNYKGVKAYAQSKLANILFSKALSRRLDPNHVTANSLHPGTIRTSIGNKNNNGLPALAWNLFKPFMKSIEKGAETSIFLATDETLKGVTGKYFDNKKSVSPNRAADNVDIQEKLWVFSLNQTGIEDKITN